MKKAVIFLVSLAILLTGCVLKIGTSQSNYSVLNKQDGTEFIDYKNFTKDSYAVQSGSNKINRECYVLPENLKSKCQKVKGELVYKVTGGGFSTAYTFGCYPAPEASDVGKNCGAWNAQGDDSLCQGWCIWTGGDVVSNNDYQKCSSFKKPYFALGERKDRTYVDVCGYKTSD